MNRKSKVPQLRFPEFTDEWEQRKLSDFLTVSKLKNNDEVFNKEHVLSVSGEYGIVNQIEFQGRSFAGVSVANYGVVETGDIVYTKSPLKSNPYGIIKTNKGKPGIVSTLYAVYKPKDNTAPEFVQTYFEQDARMNNYMHPLVNKGAKNDMKVSAENALKGLVIFPCKKEQLKISEFFANLDNLITLHQRKLVNLNNIKKSMLGKLFPKKGEKYPEVRFEGFTGEWEQRKLEDVVDFLDTMRKPLKESDRIGGPYPYYGASGIVDYVNDYLFDEELVLLSEDGANITDRNYPVCFLASGKYWVNNHAHVLKTKEGNENNFICNSLERKDYNQYNTGMAMPKLNQEVCRDIPIACPKFEEQKKIGDFFRSLDNLITLHQRKLDNLKNIKKGFLQQMFA